jgi:hypothetical protein
MGAWKKRKWKKNKKRKKKKRTGYYNRKAMKGK